MKYGVEILLVLLKKDNNYTKRNIFLQNFLVILFTPHTIFTENNTRSYFCTLQFQNYSRH